MENYGKYICNYSYERTPEEKVIGKYNCQYLNSNKLLEMWNYRDDIREIFKTTFNWLTYCKKVGLIR